jgi:hypothetical protein
MFFLAAISLLLLALLAYQGDAEPGEWFIGVGVARDAHAPLILVLVLVGVVVGNYAIHNSNEQVFALEVGTRTSVSKGVAEMITR